MELRLTFFQNSLPSGREVGPVFSLSPSLAVPLVAVDGACPGGGQPLGLWVSRGGELALSDLSLAGVLGDFSAP